MSDLSKSKQRVTLLVEDSASPNCLRHPPNMCPAGSMSMSSSLGITNSTVALEVSSMDQQLSYAKLSTRSATTSVQFNFDANGAMYRSTTICVEEGTMRGDGDTNSSSSNSSTADSSCFATFQPLSTEECEEESSDSGRVTKGKPRRDSNSHAGNEDPLTYFSPTTSTCCDDDTDNECVVVCDAAPVSCSPMEEEDTAQLLDPLPPADVATAPSAVVGGSSPPCNQKSAKGNPLDPEAEEMDDDQTKKFFSF